GDRDGNPWVTADVTRWTLRENALASLTRYRARVIDLLKALSVSERANKVPESFRAHLKQELEASGQSEAIRPRNPGEAYRQFLILVLGKLEGAIVRQESAAIGIDRPAYANAEELIFDLQLLEDALIEAGLGSLGVDLVRPVRIAAQIFRFSTVRLDLRENTPRTTEALQALWWPTAGRGKDTPPEPNTPEWRNWLLRELALPADSPRAMSSLPPTAHETTDIFRSVHEPH